MLTFSYILYPALIVFLYFKYKIDKDPDRYMVLGIAGALWFCAPVFVVLAVPALLLIGMVKGIEFIENGGVH